MQTIESRIEQVTVYARGARVRRVASVRGEGVVRFTGLPIALVDDSVRVEVEGGATVTAVRAGVDVPVAATAAEESAELRAARLRGEVAAGEVDRLSRALEQLASAPVIADDPSDDPPAAWAAIVAARRTLIATRSERERALRDALTAASAELEQAQRAYRVAVEHDAKTGSARDPKLHEVRKHVELDVTGSGDAVIRIDYQVNAARWAPSYVARFDGAKIACELRAVVAQDSGEDWTGVALRLSTAEPDRFDELPELHPLKIGRRQPEPARRGFRAPPVGADALYADYDRAFPRRAPPQPFTAQSALEDSTFEGEFDAATKETRLDELAMQAELGEATIAPPMRAFRPGPAGNVRAAPPAPAAAPMAAFAGGAMPRGELAKADLLEAMPKKRMRAEATSLWEPAPGGPNQRVGVHAPDRSQVGNAIGGKARLDYGNLRMAPASAFARGALVAAPRHLTGDRATSIDHLALPPGFQADWSHAYDYAFAADGKVDVKSDASWHSLAITTREGTIALRYVAVPREQPDVFRLARLTNPFDGPLLPGPIDVYDQEQFVITSDVEFTPPGGAVELGLGVDPSIKIARNVEFHEEAAGMLRGALRLVHAIAIDVENLSKRPVDVEVRERVPVVREGDDEVEVTIGKAEPAWERFAPDSDAPDELRLRGGYRWRLPIAAGAKQKLRAAYEVKIASKLELVGGNRREP